MDFIDTHCHIQSINEVSDDNTANLWSKANLSVNQVLKNAFDQDVKTLIVIGCSLKDSAGAIKLASLKSNCYASVGIHPHEASQFLKIKSAKQKFEELLNLKKVVAIGECGLDYFYNHSDQNSQKEVLKFQIELALKYNLPLIFHVREAFSDFWPILDSFETNLKAVLHSYTDNLNNLKIALTKNFLIGVNGIATFAKDEALKEVFKTIPLTSLVLETDSPYLTPTPFRGNINQPKNIRIIANYLAELKGEELTEIALKTSENAKRLFRI